MFCKYCGSLIDKDSSYCNHCGKRQNENDEKFPNTSGTNVHLHKYKLKKKALFFVLGGLLLLLVIWLIISLCNRNQIADITIDKVSRELAEATKKYDELDNFHEGLAKVCKNNKYGFIDKLGHEIIPCVYDEAEDFKFGVSIVVKNKKKGAINQYDDMVIPCKYDYISSFGEDSLAVASLNEKSGFIDLKGNIVIPFNYEFCNNFSEGLAAVQKDGLYGFINKKGELVIPCKYTNLYNECGFCEGLAGVSIDGGSVGIVDDKWGYIDKTGKIAIPFQDGLTGAPFSSGLSVKYRGGMTMSFDKNGFPAIRETPFEGAFINKNGELASEYFEVQNIQGFRDGYSVIIDKTGWEGLINTRGEFVIPCKYSFIANGFDDKYVVVGLNGKYGIARKETGEAVVPIIYEEIGWPWAFKEGVISVKKDGKMGCINDSNQVVISFIYDEVDEFSEGFAVVQRYGKYGYVDRYGHDTFSY